MQQVFESRLQFSTLVAFIRSGNTSPDKSGISSLQLRQFSKLQKATITVLPSSDLSAELFAKSSSRNYSSLGTPPSPSHLCFFSSVHPFRWGKRVIATQFQVLWVFFWS